jgi:hypothetical protein
MKITIYTDISEYEAEQPIPHRRGFKGYPYAVVVTEEGIREIKEYNGMGNLFNTLARLIEKDARKRR